MCLRIKLPPSHSHSTGQKWNSVECEGVAKRRKKSDFKKKSKNKNKTKKVGLMCVRKEYARRLRMAICYLSLFNFVWLNNMLFKHQMKSLCHNKESKTPKCTNTSWTTVSCLFYFSKSQFLVNFEEIYVVFTANR